jgi:hypothetical protein
MLLGKYMFRSSIWLAAIITEGFPGLAVYPSNSRAYLEIGIDCPFVSF